VYLKVAHIRKQRIDATSRLAHLSPAKSFRSPGGTGSVDLESMKSVVLDYIDKVFPPVYNPNRCDVWHIPYIMI
jgi:hypothetical protein